MEELVKVIFENNSNEKLQENGVRTIKNKKLLAPGVWNGRQYSSEEISKAFNNTNWQDKDVISLIADHRDDDSKGRPLTIRDWLGYISNQYLGEDGCVYGDLNLCDSELSVKLIEGKAPFGISPFVYGMFDGQSQKDFIFKNFAVVVEPACKECYINDYLGDDGFNKEVKELSINERIKAKLHKDISNSSEQGVQIQLKGGKKNNMSEEEVENKEKTVEEVKEESAVEAESTEEVKEEPKEVEEESEEKLMETIANATGKLLSKKKKSPEQAKMEKLESEISLVKDMVVKLSESIQKLSENKVAESEKLSAKPRTLASTRLEETGFSFGGKIATKGSLELANMLKV